MKSDEVAPGLDGERRRRFLRHLLDDLLALDRMHREGLIESGVRRIGAEQEVFLVDASRRPAPAALDMLAKLQDPHFTTELGMFNLELNLDPCSFGGDCLSALEAQLAERLELAHRAGESLGVQVVLTGILPTIRKSDLGLESMVPKPRYQLLDRVMKEMRGGQPYEIHIRGIDEVLFRHDSVMVEACNASFQVHLQVGPDEFPNLYNIAQVAAGPVLACSANSPLLFGRQLWAETRTALFQQSVDTRSASQYLRESSPRVTFGKGWVRRSVLELYREDVARFRTLIGIEVHEDPFEKLARGEAPELAALRHHNGTIYRWNRACYGITEGRAHLRIENRVLPSGPSVVDEIANGALWLGLVTGLAARHEDITQVMEFEHALSNFMTAARQGLGAHLVWLEGKELPAATLLLDHVLPLAREGLERADVRAADVDRYLGVIEERVRTGLTGARWLTRSFVAMKDAGTPGERLSALVGAALARQKEGKPVAQWDLARVEESGGWRHNFLKVEQFMSTDLVSVHPEDPVELAANLMEWEKIRHVPVEDHDHRFVGLLSYRAILRLLTDRRRRGGADDPVPVSAIMRREIVSVGPSATTLEAIALMREHDIGALPVLHEGRLVGMVTERDFLTISRELLEQKLNA